MKTLTSAMLGLSLMIGSAALSFAASQKTDDKSATANSASSTATPAPSTKVKKHHHKKVKNTAPASTPANTPAANPTK